MICNAAGDRVQRWWQQLPSNFPSVAIDAAIIMPNQFHGIVVIKNSVSIPRPAPSGLGVDTWVYPSCDRPTNHHLHRDRHHAGEHVGSPRRGLFQTEQCSDWKTFTDRVSLSQIMQWFKTMTTNEYICGVKQSDWQAFDNRFWQRNYYERILRSDRTLDTVRRYIIAHSQNWS